MKTIATISIVLGAFMGFLGTDEATGTNYVISDTYRDLRNRIFTLDPASIGMSPSSSNQIWGVIMETGYRDGAFTLVTLADGTVSLYFSNGSGRIGVGEHEGPRKACYSFLSEAPKFIKYAKPAKKFLLPKEGNTRFYFLTYEGLFSVENKKDDLGNNRLPLSSFFFMAQEVINQARIVDDLIKRKAKNLLHAATTGNTSRVEDLLEKGDNPNVADETGLSPLMAAAYSGNTEVLKILIKYRCSIDNKDSSGYTALMFASNAGEVKCAKILIDAGADVNSKDNDGSTPIMFAAQNGHNELVRLLLKKGADPNIAGNHGLTAIGFAVQNGHKETEKFLRGK